MRNLTMLVMQKRGEKRRSGAIKIINLVRTFPPPPAFPRRSNFVGHKGSWKKKTPIRCLVNWTLHTHTGRGGIFIMSRVPAATRGT